MNSIAGFVAGNPLFEMQGCLPLSLRGFPLFFLGDTSCSVRDPELNQSRNARDREQCPGRKKPSAKVPACEPGYHGPQHRPARAHGRDHVAYPVDEVEERTFRLRPRLTLNSYIELWVLTQVLSQDILRSQHEANRARREWPFQCPVPLHAHESVPSFPARRCSASE